MDIFLFKISCQFIFLAFSNRGQTKYAVAAEIWISIRGQHRDSERCNSSLPSSVYLIYFSLSFLYSTYGTLGNYRYQKMTIHVHFYLEGHLFILLPDLNMLTKGHTVAMLIAVIHSHYKYGRYPVIVCTALKGCQGSQREVRQFCLSPLPNNGNE